MKLKYNEDLEYYVEKEDFLEEIVNILCKIFNKTFSSTKIFNAELLIRQNYLTIVETPEIMNYLFNIDNFVYIEDEDDTFGYCLVTLKNEVVDRVIKELNIKDLDIEDIIK